MYCLRFYKGDEKIKNFIWDLVTPTESGEVQKITRNHSGLHNPVPRGRNAKGKKGGKGPRESPKDPTKSMTAQISMDPNHWSKNEKYDGDIYLENNYKKHLHRHANR